MDYANESIEHLQELIDQLNDLINRVEEGEDLIFLQNDDGTLYFANDNEDSVT